MAWITGLAGKAENLLNTIDKNTAAVLSKDKFDIESHSQLTDVTFTSSQKSFGHNETESPSRLAQFIRPPHSRKSPAKLISQANQDEELMTFLNTPSATPIKQANNMNLILSQSSSSLETDHNRDSMSEGSHCSGRSSPAHILVEVPNINEIILPSDTQTENQILRNEVERLRNELLVAVHVDETIDSEHDEMLNNMEAMKKEHEYKLGQQRLEIEHLMKNSRNSDLKKKITTAQKNLEEQNEILSRRQMENQKELEELREKLHRYEGDNGQMSKQIFDLEGRLERTRMELQSTRQELEQHRARALKTLQEKAKLIAELRGNASDVGPDSAITTMELNQLRQECSALRQENQQVCEQLRMTREELINADIKIEETCRKFATAGREAQEIIALERRKRIEIEEDARIQCEEARQLKDELTSQQNKWSSKIKKQETEISRLRSQLSAISTPSSAVESRLSTLTQTLVVKQNELENLTTEKNALRLQLERIEHEYRKAIGNSKKPYNVNDTDDAKAQVPTFLMETPFDTTVARRVKRAYSSLDAISVRTGVFLRRYPLARIFVITYIGLLQFWVLVVLLSQSPESH